MTIDEIVEFDAEVRLWYQSLPPPFLHLDQCPASLLSAQYIMRNRYHNLRLLLYRSVLLRYAHAMAPLQSLPTMEQEAVRRCRSIACDAIDQIYGSRQSLNKLVICSAVWYLYQASMVLLLSIMIDNDHPESTKWQASIETALSLLSNSVPWSRAAVRSKEVVESLLHVCTASSSLPSNTHDLGNLVELQDETLWDLLGLNTFTDEGTISYASSPHSPF